MRGKVYIEGTEYGGIGITPAHAGKRYRHKQKPSPGQDHPRACGEKKAADRCDRREVGSPPRMRGKVDSVKIAADNVGITPAHAGKSFAFDKPPPPLKDHPRACGEKVIDLICMSWELGSPPRMRGKVTLIE